MIKRPQSNQQLCEQLLVGDSEAAYYLLPSPTAANTLL
jgi:hypothetical protein